MARELFGTHGVRGRAGHFVTAELALKTARAAVQTLDADRRHLRVSELDLSGTSVLLDCANGATCTAGPEIFRRLGASVDVIADQPDGRNINRDCGSTHLGGVAERMAGGDYDIGFAFDGDGD